MSDASAVEEAAICAPGGGGLVLPLGGDFEADLPKPLRAVVYLIGLGWCFMGVAIIADVFMAAIEKVTSKKSRRFNSQTGRWYTFEVWNATVANLTLMALGSSAPEILLNIIDIFAKDFYLEGLGPGTIVGSAAFNLLMIIAVCIIAIPDGQVRYIKEIPVYICTATFSIFAYLWLIVILLFSSPHVVELWEGVATFLFFPILTFIAWVADKGYCVSSSSSAEKRIFSPADMTDEEIAEAELKVRREHGEGLSNEQVARILAVQNPVKKTRAHYRINATRNMTGGKKVDTSANKSLTLLAFLGSAPAKVVPLDEDEEDADGNERPYCRYRFPVQRYAVLESCGEAVIKVERIGGIDVPGKVWYETKEGSAKYEEDFTHTEGWLEFKAGQTEAEIKVEVKDDEDPEEDMDFTVVLSQPEVEGKRIAAVVKEESECQVVIIDDDEPGVLSFYPADTMTVYQRIQDFAAKVVIQRSNGSCGEVKVQYTTEGDSAIPHRDFVPVSGELTFASEQIEASFEVTIKGVPRYESTDRFRVILTEPTGGAKLDPDRDGGEDKSILTITIEADKEARDRVDKVKASLMVKWDRSKVGSSNWLGQFQDALYVNGSEDGDDDEPPSFQDKVMHVINMPWKLLFALVPPTDYCGGWAAFFASLAMIGLVTMVIGDMASLLGCVLCLPDDVTAITFVALGTSVPDMFASKSAAEQDPYADASVGNVTGSNSVNVFLGLGLPWMIAAFNWSVAGKSAKWDSRFQDHPDLDWLGTAGSRRQGFVVEAGSLAFSVGVFSCCALCCIVLLALRRRYCGGELGGPSALKWISAGVLVFLWVAYIAASTVKSITATTGDLCSS